MNVREYAVLTTALENSGLAGRACFNIRHQFKSDTERGHDKEYWDCILTPMIGRIYFIPAIMDVVKILSFEVAVYTDVNQPGCIIFH